MDRLEFESISDFADRLRKVYDTLYDINEDADVSIIAKYEEAKQIIKELIAYHGFDIHSISLEDEEFDCYYDEYIISLANISNTDDVFCEPFKRGDKYINDESDATFVLDNCNSACQKTITSSYIFEVGFTEDSEEDTDLDTSDMESTYISRDKNSNPIGFQKTWSDTKDGISSYSSYSFYSSNSEELKKMADIYNVNL